MTCWKKITALALLLAFVCAFSGCATTVEEMYCLPRRSEGYQNLQAVMDPFLESLSYAAPSSGRNQQAVQMADLDGDGVEEAILYAKGSGEHPLNIIIFRKENQEYSLMNSIGLSGSDFDQVEYVQMDGMPGLELVVGCQVSEQVMRNVAVFRFENGEPEQMLSANYRTFLICDLDQNNQGDLLVLTGGTQEADGSFAQWYTIRQGTVEQSVEAPLSQGVDQLKRIMTGKLHGGQNAVFIASTADPGTIVTDVFALVDGSLTNVSRSNESGTSVKTLRDNYVYADDIDQDGEMELPSLIPMVQTQERSTSERLIRWYSMTPEGDEVTKRYTYHNYQDSWYLELSEEAIHRITVAQEGAGVYRFGTWNPEGEDITPMWTIYVLTGDDRSALAGQENRFTLYKTDSVVYACKMDMGAMQLGVTQEMLTDAFHLIQPEWYTGEM